MTSSQATQTPDPQACSGIGCERRKQAYVWHRQYKNCLHHANIHKGSVLPIMHGQHTLSCIQQHCPAGPHPKCLRFGKISGSSHSSVRLPPSMLKLRLLQAVIAAHTHTHRLAVSVSVHVAVTHRTFPCVGLLLDVRA